MARKKAVVSVSADLVLKALAFPDKARIVGVRPFDAENEKVELIVESPELPEVEPGDVLPHASVEITLRNKGQRPFQFFDFRWGVPGAKIPEVPEPPEEAQNPTEAKKGGWLDRLTGRWG